MSRVITFSPKFPSYHPRAGEPTNFEAAIWKGLKKNHLRDKTYTIYSNHAKLMKGGYWQIPIVWRDLMLDPSFKPKFHTIRAGHRWKVGDVFSPRVWSKVPYKSKQITIGPDIEIKKVWDFYFSAGLVKIGDGKYDGEVESDHELLEQVAINDGLGDNYYYDLLKWFHTRPFDGQIICWNEEINY